MAWYRNGTIAVTNGSPIVTGTGTAFVANVQVGHAINLPDGRAYEVAAVNSDTQITLGNPSGYLGATASGQAYSVQPNQGFAQAAATALATLLTQFTNYLTTALAGRFGDGTAAGPGISFAADQDTGVRRPADNTLALTTGGADRLTASAAGVATSVPLTAPTVTAGTGSFPAKLTADASNLANFGLGFGAMNAAATGVNNVAVGQSALGALTTGSANASFGQYAGSSLTTGQQNALFGNSAGNKVTTGSFNTLVGYGAGLGLTGGENSNTIVGNWNGPAGITANVVLADGNGQARFRWDGTVNTITGNAAVIGNLQLGTVSAGGTGTATPVTLNLGSTYSTAAGSNPKLRLYDDGTGLFGFGVSSGQLDYIIGAANGSAATHAFWANGGVIARLGVNATSFASGLSAAAGNFTVDASGNTVHAGKSTSAGALVTGEFLVKGSGGAARFERVISSAPSGASGAGIELGVYNGNPIVNAVNRDNNSATALQLGGTAIIPIVDNFTALGSGSYRFSTVYAGSGAINTSDGTQKTIRASEVTDQERAWARAIRPLAYQFNDAIADKGSDKARLHWGVIAQDVYAAGIAAGIADPMHYAFLCRDALTTTESNPITVQRQVMATITVEEDRYEVRDGCAVLTKAPVEQQQPVFDLIPVVDANGKPVMEMVSPAQAAVAEVLDNDGEVVTPAEDAIEAVYAPATYRVPSMEDVTETQETTVPMLDGDGKPVLRWGVRYVELLMFLLACQPEPS